MPKGPSLYDADFVAWTEEQAALLRELSRAGTNLSLDWENLAEEVEDLGNSLRNELSSRIATVIEHLMKLECSPARDPRKGWMETILRERASIDDLLARYPSLNNAVSELVSRRTQQTGRLVRQTLELYNEAGPETAAKLRRIRYSPEQILGEWFPADVGAEADT